MTRIKLFVILGAVLAGLTCHCQGNAGNDLPSPQRPEECHTISISGVSDSSTPLPYQALICTDVRIEQGAKTGYFNHQRDHKSAKICLQPDPATAFSKMARETYRFSTTEGEGTVYAFIRNFRFSVTNTVDSLRLHPGYIIYLKIEFYISKGACYYPLCRFDSTASGPLDYPAGAGPLITRWFGYSLQKMARTPAAIAVSRG